MQKANVMVALGGDVRNTVPKTNITAAEVGTLMAIHGSDAIFDIEPLGDEKIVNREERERLRLIYGRAMDSENRSIFESIFPGAAARVFESLEELPISPEQYKVKTRVTAEDVVEAPEEDAKARITNVKRKGGKTAEAAAKEQEGELDELDSDDNDTVLD